MQLPQVAVKVDVPGGKFESEKSHQIRFFFFSFLFFLLSLSGWCLCFSCHTHTFIHSFVHPKTLTSKGPSSLSLSNSLLFVCLFFACLRPLSSLLDSIPPTLTAFVSKHTHKHTQRKPRKQTTEKMPPGNGKKSSECNIQVAVRCRPLNAKEKDENSPSIVECAPHANKLTVKVRATCGVSRSRERGEGFRNQKNRKVCNSNKDACLMLLQR